MGHPRLGAPRKHAVVAGNPRRCWSAVWHGPCSLGATGVEGHEHERDPGEKRAGEGASRAAPVARRGRSAGGGGGRDRALRAEEATPERLSRVRDRRGLRRAGARNPSRQGEGAHRDRGGDREATEDGGGIPIGGTCLDQGPTGRSGRDRGDGGRLAGSGREAHEPRPRARRRRGARRAAEGARRARALGERPRRPRPGGEAAPRGAKGGHAARRSRGRALPQGHGAARRPARLPGRDPRVSDVRGRVT